MSIGSGADQDRLLFEATAVVEEQSFFLKRSIEKENTREALRAASQMVGELRTSQLAPKKYYDLYSKVVVELQNLYNYFCDSSKHGRKMVDLYESVQHAGTILPRLYLLVTCAAAYIQSGEAPPKEVLKDLAELCKGVQDPLRGLFLRYYMSQMMKDKLPDIGSPYEEDDGTIDTAFEFLHENLDETNRLWIRMQSYLAARDKNRMEKERQDLRVLVTANLVRLSKLEGLTVSFYKKKALPQLLETATAIKDNISQQLFLENIIEIFPNEFHVQTLEIFLQGCGETVHTVDLKSIVLTLSNMLAHYLKENADNSDVPTGQEILSLFRHHLQMMMERKMDFANKGDSKESDASRELGSCLEMGVAFMQFSLSLRPDDIGNIDLILESALEIVKKYVEITGQDRISGPGSDKVVDILACPLKSFGLGILEMDHYITLMEFLDYDTRKRVASSLVDGIIEGNHYLTDTDAVSHLFKFISPLVKDEADAPRKNMGKKFVIEQQLVAKLCHQISSENTDDEFALITAMRSFFGRGGNERMAITLPSVFYSAFTLMGKIRAYDELRAQEDNEETYPARAITIKKVYQFVHKTLTELQRVAPETAAKCWLVAAGSADAAEKLSTQPGVFEPICYEFLTQGLICFEEEVSESTKQFSCLSSFVGTLCCISCLEEENFEMMSQRLTQHAARLLKKPMQVRAIALCSNMFWCEGKRDGKRVLECLQKCLKITDAVVTSDPKQVGLWVEMLDKYLFFYENGVDDVNPSFVRDLLDLCKEHIEYAKKEPSSEEDGSKAQSHFNDTLNYIRIMQKSRSPEVATRFRVFEL